MKYQFIEQHKQEFPIVVMCHVLEVSESGFYAWRKRPVCQRKREDAQLSSHIRQIFVSHREVYGSPRIHAQLADQGYRCSRKRIARLMRENGITASRKRRRVVTTNSRHENPVAPNLLQRDFTAPGGADTLGYNTDCRGRCDVAIPARDERPASAIPKAFSTSSSSQ